ncbi:nucleotidyltransferase family protein [Candidatus Woesearchaeota archaeon]|nr:MAG: nucleotidyltransferase family protein [Candidatus Woesearchaeota archaeon]
MRYREKMKKRISITINRGLIDEVDRIVDGRRIKNRSHAIELLLSRALGSHKIQIGLILAGGAGTRLRPITHEIPKPLLPVKDKPVMEYNIELLRRHGIKRIVLALGYKAEKIKEYFGDGSRFGVEFIYVIEKKPLGTAGPLRLAKQYLKNTFVVANADELKDINIDDMYRFHKSNHALITIALTTVEDPSKYGVAKLEGSRILEFIEKPDKDTAPSKLINSGLYIIEPQVLDYIPKGYAMLERDVFPKLAKMGKVYGYPFTGQWFNTGTLEEYERAIKNWQGFTTR